MRVLLVEGDLVEAGALSTALVLCGHVVEHAHSVRDAVEAAQVERFDVAIVDLKLSDAAGPEVVRIVRRAAERAALIVFTGSDDESELLACYEAGASDVIEKPARLAVIEHALLQGRARQSFINRTSAAAAIAGAQALAASFIAG